MSAALGVLLGGFAGVHVPRWLMDAVGAGLAGVVLFADNTPDVATARQVTDALRTARPDVVVAIDEEGGDVTRLQCASGAALPGNAALGVVDDPALTRRCAAALGDLLALAGVDVDLAPVLDVASEPRNPVIGVRSFGPTAELAARHGAAFVEGLTAAGVRSCGKHYPGHGSTTLDSHLSLPVLAVGTATLAARDEAPFHAVPLDAVMTAHVVVPDRGPEPASLSRWAVDALRATGFTGPIVTDALGMGAIAERVGLGEACVRALAAGADLLCLDAPQHRDEQGMLAEAVSAIDAAVAAGRLDRAALTRSAARNATLARTTTRPVASTDAVMAAEQALGAAGADAARRAVTATGDVALPDAPLLMDLRAGAHFATGRTSPALAAALHARWPATRTVAPGAPTDVPHDARPWVAQVRQPCSDAREAALLAAILERRPDTVVVHCGTAEAAPAAPRLILAHGSGPANATAAVALLGGGR